MALKLFARADHLLNPSLLLGTQEPCERVLICGVNFSFDLFSDCAKHKEEAAGVQEQRWGVSHLEQQFEL